MMAGLPRLKIIKGVLTCFSKQLFAYVNVGISSVTILISVFDVERKESSKTNHIVLLILRRAFLFYIIWNYLPLYHYRFW